MFNGYDFIYDGKSSISENLRILSTESSTFGFCKSVPSRDVNLFKSNQSSKWKVSGIVTPEPLSFQMQLMMYSDDTDLYADGNPAIERNRLSRIRHWLCDKTDFKKLQIMKDDLRDLYFMAIFKDIEDFEAGGDVCGFKITVLCDAEGAWEEKNIEKNISGSSTFQIQVLQDGIYEVEPVYTLTMNSSEVTITVNGEDMILKNVTPGSTITIDTENLIAKSSEGDNLFTENRFNKCFPRFVWGKNTISVFGNCKLNINYKMIREVGC